MSLPLRLCGPRVLIEPDRAEQKVETRESGILLAKTLAAAVDGEDAQEAWYSGTVIAVGEEHPVFDVRPFVLRRLREIPVFRCEEFTHGYEVDGVDSDDIRTLIAEIETLPTERPRDFAVGDRVCFTHTAGEQIDIEGQRYLILNETDILGVLNA